MSQDWSQQDEAAFREMQMRLTPESDAIPVEFLSDGTALMLVSEFEDFLVSNRGLYEEMRKHHADALLQYAKMQTWRALACALGGALAAAVVQIWSSQ